MTDRWNPNTTMGMLEAEKARVNQLVTELAEVRKTVDHYVGVAHDWKDRAEKAERKCHALGDEVRRAEHDLNLMMPDSLKRGMAHAAAGEVQERPDLDAWGDQGGDFEDLPIADGWDEIARERDYWQDQAGKKDVELTGAVDRAETWEENHQILSEHYERMTARAEKSEQLADKFYRRALSAEQTADWFNKDRDHWMDCAHGRGSRIDRADEEINSLTAQARAWKAEAEKAEALVEKHSDEVDRLANELEAKDQRIADVEDVAENLDAELDEWKDSALQWFKEWTDATVRVHEYRRRSESWWEAAKTLCRYWRMGEAEHNECLKDLMRERDRADWAKARVEILEGVSYELGQKARYMEQIRCSRDYWQNRATEGGN